MYISGFGTASGGSASFARLYNAVRVARHIELLRFLQGMLTFQLRFFFKEPKTWLYEA